MLVIEGKEIEKVLILKDHWLYEILTGNKTLEIRGRNTKVRGYIGLMASGTNEIAGIVKIDNTMKIDSRSFSRLRKFHHIKYFNDVKYEKIWGWMLSGAKLLDNPVKIDRKKGQVVWVNV